MPKEVKITCDQCGADLTTTGNCEDYRIALRNESIQSRSGFVTVMGASPHLKSNAYFCGTRCLAKWVSANFPTSPPSPG